MRDRLRPGDPDEGPSLGHPELEQVRYRAIARVAITCAERDLAEVLAGRREEREHYWRGLAAVRSACGRHLPIAVRLFDWAYDATLASRACDQWGDASPVPTDFRLGVAADDSSSAIARWKRSMLLPRVCERCKTPIVAVEVSLGNRTTVWRCPACHAELDGLVE